MEIKVKLDEFALLPTRAHDTDAGWDYTLNQKDKSVTPNDISSLIGTAIPSLRER